MCPHGYYNLMRESKDPTYLRLRMVQQARRIGIKPTAALFGCSPNTVRKWVRRFDRTLASLQERSRAPVHRPRRLSAKKRSIAGYGEKIKKPGTPKLQRLEGYGTRP